jgi:hypothetical protein
MARRRTFTAAEPLVFRAYPQELVDRWYTETGSRIAKLCRELDSLMIVLARLRFFRG